MNYLPRAYADSANSRAPLLISEHVSLRRYGVLAFASGRPRGIELQRHGTAATRFH